MPARSWPPRRRGSTTGQRRASTTRLFPCACSTRILLELVNSPAGTLRLALVSMATAENLADLAAILADATAREERRSLSDDSAAQINSDVYDRSAEKARRA